MKTDTKPETIKATIDYSPCPKCSARCGDPCVYLAGIYPSTNAGRIGQPTTRPHAERLVLWRNYQLRKASKARRERLIAVGRIVPPQVQTLLDIRQAHQTFDRLESAQVAAWLRRYGSILWEDA